MTPDDQVRVLFLLVCGVPAALGMIAFLALVFGMCKVASESDERMDRILDEMESRR